jgi:uroporphyrinogen-III decarboxylase
VVRVKVVVPEWTDHPTSIVAALFINSEVATKVASQEIAPGKVAQVMLEFEMVAPTQAIGIDVRVGPGRAPSISTGVRTVPIQTCPNQY